MKKKPAIVRVDLGVTEVRRMRDGSCMVVELDTDSTFLKSYSISACDLDGRQVRIVLEVI